MGGFGLGMSIQPMLPGFHFYLLYHLMVTYSLSRLSMSPSAVLLKGGGGGGMSLYEGVASVVLVVEGALLGGNLGATVFWSSLLFLGFVKGKSLPFSMEPVLFKLGFLVSGGLELSFLAEAKSK